MMGLGDIHSLTERIEVEGDVGYERGSMGVNCEYLVYIYISILCYKTKINRYCISIYSIFHICLMT